jgi:hypothetical protein
MNSWLASFAWLHRWKIMRQFGLDLFDAGQAAAEFLG